MGMGRSQVTMAKFACVLLCFVLIAASSENSVSSGSTGTSSSVPIESKNYGSGDPLFLHNSDHPGMILVSKPLTVDNYLSWSRSMQIALGAKVKLGFVNGKCIMPAEDSVDFEQWHRVDCMVTSWLLNSMSKDIVDAFLYTTNARQLWLEIEERFGESNGPLLYQLQREISSISQGDQTVVAYYTTLKKLWDELSCYMPIPPCSCGAAKVVAELTSTNRLMQFLMGLTDAYDNVRNQILVMDPLPSVNKAYSMILRVEKQRQVQNSMSTTLDNTVLMVKGGPSKITNKRIDKKHDQHCTHCNSNGHIKENCFKLHGFPDWYKELRDKKGLQEKRKQPPLQKNYVNFSDTPLVSSDQSAASFTEMFQQELHKFLQQQKPTEAGVVNMTHFGDFSGPQD